MLKPSVELGRALWLVVVVANWLRFQASTLVEGWAETLLSSWEESLKGLLREGFAAVSRLTNGAAGWVLRLFSAQQAQEGSQRSKAWQSWWREDRRAMAACCKQVLCSCGRVSTRRRAGRAPSTPSSRGTGAGRAPPSPRTPVSASAQRVAPLLAPLPGARSETGGLSARPRAGSSYRRLKLEVGARGSWLASRWQGLGNWWQGEPPAATPGRLRRHGSDLFDRPSGAPARTKPLALLPPTTRCRQLHCTVGPQPAQPSVQRRGPAWTAQGAGVTEGVLGAGWAVAETSKKRGLLEDFRLQCELGLSVAFETLRWLLRKALLLPAARRPLQARQAADLRVSHHRGVAHSLCASMYSLCRSGCLRMRQT